MTRTASASSEKEANKEVGKEALAYCTSCKMDLNHIIVSMQGDRIAKVECRTCKKTHVYKAPKGITEPDAAPKAKKTRAKKEPKVEANPIEHEWEKLMAAHRGAPAKSYTMKGHFGLGDKIAHPTFGDGIVGKIVYPNKIEVIFKHDLKVLIHAGTSQVAH